MRAVVVERPGDPSVLTLREVPAPALRPRDVRIAVAACGVCFHDVVVRNGTFRHGRGDAAYSRPRGGRHRRGGGPGGARIPARRSRRCHPPPPLCGDCRCCRGGQETSCPQREFSGRCRAQRRLCGARLRRRGERGGRAWRRGARGGGDRRLHDRHRAQCGPRRRRGAARRARAGDRRRRRARPPRRSARPIGRRVHDRGDDHFGQGRATSARRAPTTCSWWLPARTFPPASRR